ncbi:MAG: [protein-PII] uridylyltransferase [Acidobacteriaceae bacterium]
MPQNSLTKPIPGQTMREFYQQQMLEIRRAFEASGNGHVAVEDRAALADTVVTELWRQNVSLDKKLASGIAVIAVGGYGRKQLFPCSDLDLLFLHDGSRPEKELKDSIRRICQEMWDCGIRVSPQTRTLAECDRFDGENAEFTLSLLDHRFLIGDAALYTRLTNDLLPKLLQREGLTLTARLTEMTLARHAKYGHTLFHLEPNIKDCPGGLRDSHVCQWLAHLAQAVRKPRRKVGIGDKDLLQSLRTAAEAETAKAEFQEAVDFLLAVRCFLHYRAGRDDNTLDWQAQDQAASASIGSSPGRKGVDAAYWMRFYYRHARSIFRRVTQMLDQVPRGKRTFYQNLRQRRIKAVQADGYRIDQGHIRLDPPEEQFDAAQDPDVVLSAFATMAKHGAKLGIRTEERLEMALPLLSAHLEEGPALWKHLRSILLEPHAAEALRTMHELGILELVVPEFHGIDALVIRDAYHRYTVDEHTFVVIETLHQLPQATAEWEHRLAGLLQELQHPELLYLAALMHDTGKGRSAGEHTHQSALLAKSLLARLELEPYESSMVLHLIENHLEMSAALRRDIFDAETIRAFAGKVETPDQLRMLCLFTYADIKAVHPDALTPWKAENLWRLYIATANHLDRSVDEERVHVGPHSGTDAEFVHRVVAQLPSQADAIREFLEGFPQRYLRTRTPEQVRMHFKLAQQFSTEPVQLDFRHHNHVSEITLVTPDRPMLFSTMAGALAALGMDIVTADAFSNDQGVVVDSFRFTDRFQTLELNPDEHGRFIETVRNVMTGVMPLGKLLEARSRSGKRKAAKTSVKTQIEFDNLSSSHSTLLQVVAQDTQGLLYALSHTIADLGCNVEVALIDTEGEMAIDVFYLTHANEKLDETMQSQLRESLMQAIASN